MSDRVNGLQNKVNGTIDIAKIIMAILVVGIHTEPFGFNIWLDRIFGIATRFCVPFFFVASSYFFFKGSKKIVSYTKRISILYLVWSLIYLPLNIPLLAEMSIGEVLLLLFWHGNNHSLWYLLASIIGLFITYGLIKLFKGNIKATLILSVFILLIGCAISTYEPLTGKILPHAKTIADNIGYRNGLFYAFPYMALGALIASNSQESKNSISPYKMLLGLTLSVILLAIESLILIVYFNAHSTILWMAMLPASYFLFMFLLSIKISIHKNIALFFRKMSTLIYVSHTLFIVAFNKLNTYKYFLAVFLCAFLLSYSIVFLSEKKYFTWMKYLY